MKRFGSIEEYEEYVKDFRAIAQKAAYPMTKFALSAYDNFMRCGWRDKSLYGTLLAIDERARLARLVGRAFGYDTLDRNSPQTCEECVRPGEWLRKTIGVLCVVLLFVGCSMRGDYSGPAGWKECKDFRDGEVFQFHTNTIHDIRIGSVNYSSMSVVDTEGHEHILTSSMEQYLKCKAIQSDARIPEKWSDK